MASFDQFLRNKLSEENPEIPSNLRWDNMKSNIIENVDISPKKPQKGLLFIRLGISLLLIGIAGFFVCKAVKMDRINKDRKHNEHVVQQNLIGDQEKSISPNSLGNINQSKTLKTDQVDELNTSKYTGIRKTTKSLKNSLSASQSLSEANLAKENREIPSLEKNKPESSLAAKSILSPEKASDIKQKGENLDPKNRQKSQYLESLNTIINVHYLVHSFSPLEKYGSNLRVGLPEIKSKNNAISIYAGVNNWFHSKPQLDIDDIRQNGETNLNAYLIGITYTRNLKNGWKLNTSLEFESLETRFNYQSIKDEPKLLKNQLTKIEINYVSGDSSFVYSDTVVNARSTRTVVHYNKHELINLPISIGKTMAFGKFSIGLNAGAVVNLFSDSSGRSLDKTGEIIDFSAGNNSILKNWKGVAFSAGIEASYQIENNMRIGIGANSRKYIQNWYKAESGTLSPITLQAVVFTQYAF